MHGSWSCGFSVNHITDALLQGSASNGAVGDTWSEAPNCVSVVSLRVSKALTVLALQRSFRCSAQLHRQSQAAEFGWVIDLSTHLSSAPLIQLSGIGWRSFATAESLLRDSVNANVRGFELLSDDALMRTLTLLFRQKSQTAVLWKR